MCKGPTHQECREHQSIRRKIIQLLHQASWYVAPAETGLGCLLLPHHTYTKSPGYCHTRHCTCQGMQASDGEGNTAEAGQRDHGTRAAGSSQKVLLWGQGISPAAAMQTDCRPTPEPNAGACWVKNSLPPLPTPFAAGLFLSQNMYGAWFTAEPLPHCTYQDESTQRSNSTTEPLSIACSHPNCCTEGRGFGQGLAACGAQHWGLALSNGNTGWGRPKSLDAPGQPCHTLLQS